MALADSFAGAASHLIDEFLLIGCQEHKDLSPRARGGEVNFDADPRLLLEKVPVLTLVEITHCVVFVKCLSTGLGLFHHLANGG